MRWIRFKCMVSCAWHFWHMITLLFNYSLRQLSPRVNLDNCFNLIISVQIVLLDFVDFNQCFICYEISSNAHMITPVEKIFLNLKFNFIWMQLISTKNTFMWKKTFLFSLHDVFCKGPWHKNIRFASTLNLKVTYFVFFVMKYYFMYTFLMI